MAGMGDDFDRVGIEVVIGDGFGGCVEDRRNVVLGHDVTRNGGGIRDQCSLLNIAFEDLTAGGRRQSRRRGRESTTG